MSKKNNFCYPPLLISLFRPWWNAEAHYAFNLAHYWKKNNRQVTLLGWENSPLIKKAQSSGIKNISIKNRSLFTALFSYQQCQKWLHTNPKGAICSFTSVENIGIFWLKRTQKFAWIKVKANAQPIKQNFLNNQLYGYPDCFVAASQDCLRVLSSTIKNKPNQPPAQIIYFGAESLKPKTGLTKIAAKKQSGLLADRPVFCLLGRAQKIKGHAHLLQAFQKINKPAYLLFFVKDLQEYPKEIEQWKNFIQVHHLEDQVRIVGFQNNLADQLLAVDFCVIPSLGSENICRVWVEMASIGIPAVAYDVGCLPEMIQDNHNGFLCSKDSISALQQKLQTVVEQYFLPNKQNSYQLLSTDVMQSYQQFFCLETFGQNWEKVFRNICHK